MGILLLLRGGRAVSATELSQRFEVSVRTIYRDIEVLSGLGVPVYADMGRTGGFRLREGYFLPPVTFGPEEAVSLLLGLILLRRLRVMPFPKEADFAERKLLAALPPETREAVERASRFIGFERVPADLMHHERDELERADSVERPLSESAIVGAFLRALLSRSRVTLAYRSPYREPEAAREIEPLGIFWDRDRWYLVGRVQAGGERRNWRADRVVSISPGRSMPPISSDFDASAILDRHWLREAMESWLSGPTARIALTVDQAELLKRDWFFGNARFENLDDGRVAMTYSEDRPEAAAALVRWLGPGAELLEPGEWRAQVAGSLREMLSVHEAGRS
jgi:predicted DNA-binding transcriptional regulator YafY